MTDEEQRPNVCSVCGKPSVAWTLVNIADGGGRIMLCRRHEREADRKFSELLRRMVAEGQKEAAK